MPTIPGFVPIGPLPPPVPGLPDQADFNPLLTRTHFFDGRLLTAADLTREQLYLDQRLREVGQALGAGVVRGLEARLAGGRIHIEPGLALTAAGRVLEVRAPLQVDLNDRARLAGLNGGRFAHLPHGLFMLVLAYAERPRGIAEVFPRDLAERGVEYDLNEEGVQPALLPLPVPLSQGSPFALRAALMRLAAEGALDALGLPDDAVALGVLAVSGNAPQWLDATLLRQPPRTILGPGDRQADLGRQYQALLSDVLAERQPRDGDFAATDYFRVLPPAGPLPKAAIDPVAGRQRYFPEHFEVWIAPVRQADLDLIQRESQALPAIDLSSREPVGIVVLAPLAEQAFGRLTAPLMRQPDATPTPAPPAPAPPVLLPRLDLLALRLYPLPVAQPTDTDRPAWEALWAAVDAPVFVRRPTRAAETGLSAIRIAIGAPVTPPEHEDDDADAASPTPLTDGPRDEDVVLLERIGFRRLATLRPPTDERGREALDAMLGDFGDQAAVMLAVMDLLLLIERHYDEVLWPTLYALARAGALADVRDRLVELRRRAPDAATPALVLEAIGDLRLDDGLREGWERLGAQPLRPTTPILVNPLRPGS